MSASQIPNLLTSRGGPRSRGRGRGRGGTSSTQPSAASRRDQTIQSTDSDAAVSRLSAVSLGYLEDEFAPYFVNGNGARRLPIINRGTYTRTTALDILIDAFLTQYDNSSIPEIKQIVSLGAGTDTRYFRLRKQNKHQNLLYHEFDFPAVCATKYRIVDAHRSTLCRDETLFQTQNTDIPNMDGGTLDQEPGWGLSRPIDGRVQAGYMCHPLDLRRLPSLNSLDSFPGLRGDLPTLLISECCLCYLEIDTASDAVTWFGDRIPSLGIVLYEPIGIGDAFGHMMVENLAARGIVMPTVKRYHNLNDQVERLTGYGFNGEAGGAVAVTIEDIWETWILTEERERVDRLEGLDEVEEWQMLARHYAVACGWRAIKGWEAWLSRLQ